MGSMWVLYGVSRESDSWVGGSMWMLEGKGEGILRCGSRSETTQDRRYLPIGSVGWSWRLRRGSLTDKGEWHNQWQCSYKALTKPQTTEYGCSYLSVKRKASCLSNSFASRPTSPSVEMKKGVWSVNAVRDRRRDTYTFSLILAQQGEGPSNDGTWHPCLWCGHRQWCRCQGIKTREQIIKSSTNNTNIQQTIGTEVGPMTKDYSLSSLHNLQLIIHQLIAHRTAWVVELTDTQNGSSSSQDERIDHQRVPYKFESTQHLKWSRR
jgi:hypothetical protein